jgi:hypothetical protein
MGARCGLRMPSAKNGEINQAMQRSIAQKRATITKANEAIFSNGALKAMSWPISTPRFNPKRTRKAPCAL